MPGFAAVILCVFALASSGCENHTGFNYKTPQASDFIITGTGKVAYDGNPKEVTVTAKEGSTTGRITVKYNGDTAPPTEEGTYKITFFVQSVKGWNAVSGFAGTLVITPARAPDDPAAEDFDISGTGAFLYDGSPRSVTIRPKPGKSPGTLTVYYTGAGGTAYSKNTAAPSAGGNYIVSFDVAEAEGWNAAAGLDAGVLSISARLLAIEPVLAQTYTGSEIKPAVIVRCDSVQLVPVTDYTVSYANNINAGTAGAIITGTGAYAGSTGNAAFTINRADPAAGDFETGSLNQTYGSIGAVTISPKPGKSQGAITVYYAGSAAPPAIAGAYALTFDVAETPNWNAAEGLDGGTLTINKANPVAGDFEISGLEQPEGAVSAVTITPKPGKSQGTLIIKYASSTALPTNAGTYAVTFDAAETPNWNAAAGLSGGTFEVIFNTETPYIITGSASAFTARRNGLIVGTANQPVQDVVDGVKAHAAGRDCAIRFGENAVVLNIGANSVKFNNTGGTWGVITLSGRITGSVSDSSSGTVVIADTVFVNSSADIANTAATNGCAVYFSSTGMLTISGGAVSATTGSAVYNASGGAVTISGGAVSATSSRVVYNAGGTVNITGGTVSVTGTGTGRMTVYNAGGTVNITGGTVSVTGDSSFAVHNNYSGRVNISGGTVSSATYVAVQNISSLCTVSGTAKVTSGNSGIATISGGVTEILGGTVENTSTGSAVYSFTTMSGGTVTATSGGHGVNGGLTMSGGTISVTSGTAVSSGNGEVTISGGTVSATTGTAVSVGSYNATISGGTVSATTGVAVYNSYTNKITVTGTARISSANTDSASGTIRLFYNSNTDNATAERLVIEGGIVENTAASTNARAVYYDSKGAVTISGGAVTATTGTTVYNNNTGAVNISGGTVSATTGTAAYNASTGKITVAETALLTSANITGTSGTIVIANSGSAVAERLAITGGTVENTAANSSAMAVYNASTGAVTISGGAVSATSGYAVNNNNTGAVTISGGAVSATSGYAVYNNNTGAVNISGGAVSATTGGTAVRNNSTGKITVSGTALLTSAGASSNSGTVYLAAPATDNTAERLLISGGTVANTSLSSYGNVVYNASTASVTISGGKVSAAGGVAAYNASTGKITVSGAALLTSANTTGTSGTIVIGNSGTAVAERLAITGGTVENTGTGSTPNAVYNASTGAVTISDGAVSATTGTAAYNASTGKITVSGTALVTSANTTGTAGTIVIANSGTDTAERLAITGGTVENTGTGSTANAVYNNSTGAVTISAGAVSAATGTAAYNASTGKITVSGTALLTSANINAVAGTIVIANSGTATAERLLITGGTVENTATGNANARAVYNGSTGAVTVSGGAVSAIGQGTAVYNGSTGAANISGGTVSAVTGYAVYNGSTGAANISGGIVSAATGYAAYNYSTGKITVSGTALLTSANITATAGTIVIANSGTATAERLVISGGTVENTATGNAVYNGSTGRITISSGTVSAEGGGYSVYNASTGALAVTSPPAVIIGPMYP